MNYDIEIPLDPIPSWNKEFQDGCDFATVATATVGFRPNKAPYRPVVGFTLEGVAFLSPLSVESVDPLYPPEGYEPEKLDYCAAHANANGQYHQHSAGGCQPPAIATCTSGPSCIPSNWSAAILQGFDGKNGLQLIGFAVDGFPIYGPYDEFGNLHTNLDNCNGKAFNGSYAYFTTPSWPYLPACFGPGVYDIPNTPSCTSNYDPSIHKKDTHGLRG